MLQKKEVPGSAVWETRHPGVRNETEGTFFLLTCIHQESIPTRREYMPSGLLGKALVIFTVIEIKEGVYEGAYLVRRGTSWATIVNNTERNKRWRGI